MGFGVWIVRIVMVKISIKYAGEKNRKIFPIKLAQFQLILSRWKRNAFGVVCFVCIVWDLHPGRVCACLRVVNVCLCLSVCASVCQGRSSSPTLN